MKDIFLEVEALTDKGLVKEVNQDNFLVKVGEISGTEFGIFIICDGVGGLDLGEKASYICTKLFKEWWNNEMPNVLRQEDDSVIISELNKILGQANEEIINISNQEDKKLGTTASVLMIIGDRYYIAHVGDSRIYLRNKEKLIQLTEDQSLVNLQVKRGELTLAQAKVSKQKNIILQCVGSNEILDIYNAIGRIDKEGTFLLCSDGFYNKLEDKELRTMGTKFKSTTANREEILKKYIAIVKERGERDNISIIGVNCKSNKEGKLGFLYKFFK